MANKNGENMGSDEVSKKLFEEKKNLEI